MVVPLVTATPVFDDSAEYHVNTHALRCLYKQLWPASVSEAGTFHTHPLQYFYKQITPVFLPPQLELFLYTSILSRLSPIPPNSFPCTFFSLPAQSLLFFGLCSQYCWHTWHTLWEYSYHHLQSVRSKPFTNILTVLNEQNSQWTDCSFCIFPYTHSLCPMCVREICVHCCKNLLLFIYLFFQWMYLYAASVLHGSHSAASLPSEMLQCFPESLLSSWISQGFCSFFFPCP